MAETVYSGSVEPVWGNTREGNKHDNDNKFVGYVTVLSSIDNTRLGLSFLSDASSYFVDVPAVQHLLASNFISV